MYMTMSKGLLQILNCTDFDPPAERLLDADLSINCADREYKVYEITMGYGPVPRVTPVKAIANFSLKVDLFFIV